MMLRVLPALALATLSPAAPGSDIENPANRAVVRTNGDLFLSKPSRQLTNCACAGAFDVDGEQIAFITTRGGVSTALRVVNLRTGKQVFEMRGPFIVPGRSGQGMKFDGKVAKILLDSKNSRAYLLMVIEGAPTWPVVRIDLSGAATAEVTSGLDIHLIRAGEHASNVVVLMHRMKLSPGRWLAYFLVDPDGKEIGYVGATEAEVLDFMAVSGALP